MVLKWIGVIALLVSAFALLWVFRRQIWKFLAECWNELVDLYWWLWHRFRRLYRKLNSFKRTYERNTGMNVSRGWLITMAILLALGAAGLGMALVVVPAVTGAIVGSASRPATATPLPTNTPIPTTVPTCSLAAYNLPGEVFDGGSVDVNIGGSIVTVLCKNGHIGIKSLTIQPGGCWVDQVNNLYIPDGAPWTMPNGQSVVCKDGNLQAIGGPAPIPASPTAPPAGCTADGFTFQTNDTWVINGQKSVCNNGGWKPLSAFPPTATPTLAPTAALPANAGFCPLPSPDGYGQAGGFQPIGTRPTGSNYVCMPNGQGQNIWVDP